MLALFKDIPVISNPVFRIVLGAAIVVVGLVILHNSVVVIAAGALVLLTGLASGFTGLTGHSEKG
jgi:hypothetical protein